MVKIFFSKNIEHYTSKLKKLRWQSFFKYIYIYFFYVCIMTLKKHRIMITLIGKSLN